MLKRLSYLLLIISLTVIIIQFAFKGSGPQCPDCNLIVISVDTLRYDHLSSNGYPRKTSANIDDFAKESINYTNHIATAPNTNPSLNSFHTGLYPIQNGVRNNFSILDESVPTLAELMKENGFKTAAVISNHILQPQYTGLFRGFDIYDTNMNKLELNRAHIMERDAANTTSTAIDILAKIKTNKFFIWVHYMDPHGAYNPPIEIRGMYKSDSPSLVETKKIQLYQILNHAPVTGDKTDINYYIARYDEEIFYADQQIGILISKIKELGLDKNSLIIFTADHGESLKEHNYFLEHGRTLFDDIIKVPMLIKLPDKDNLRQNSKQQIVSDPTSHVDILPALANFFNFKNVPYFSGRDILDTRIKTDAVMSEYHVNKNLKIFSARMKDYKVLDTNGSQSCYNLQQDPGENKPLSCMSTEFNKLLSMKDDYLKLPVYGNQHFVQPDAQPKEEIEKIKSLGYL